MACLLQRSTEPMVIPSLHDGRLLAIELIGPDLQLRCADVNGAQHFLVLRDIVRLRADNFLQGNIVFEVSTFSTEACPEHLIRAAYQDAEHATLAGEIEDIRTQNLTLLQLGSSYGCELVALGKGALEVRAVNGMSRAAQS